MPHAIPIIRNASFFEATYEAGQKITVSGRPFSSLTLRESGRISITAMGKTLFSDAGSLTYIPKGCTYQTQVLSPGKMRILHFDSTEEGAMLAEAPFALKPALLFPFQNSFLNAIAHYADAGCDLLTMAAAYELLHQTKQALLHKPPAPPPRLIRCRAYLDENICDTALRIGDLAEMAGVSEVYFRREFRKHYGMSPMAYIKKRRIDLAKQLLSTGIYSVTDVALHAGFDSISYFSSEFKRLTGMTPMEYAKR